jgi:hypothetical protein
MFGTILAVGAAVGTVVPWLMETSDQIEEAEKRNTDMALRQLTGQLAKADGPVEDIRTDEFVEVPADPALGGKPVLMTHTEAVWWMSAGARPGAHTKKIRKILRAQALRRAKCGAR